MSLSINNEFYLKLYIYILFVIPFTIPFVNEYLVNLIL